MGVAAAEMEFVMLLLLEVVFFLNFKGEYFLDPRPQLLNLWDLLDSV